MSTTLHVMRELAQRNTGQDTVTLMWNSNTNEVWLILNDFEPISVPCSKANDAYMHPYMYIADNALNAALLAVNDD